MTEKQEFRKFITHRYPPGSVIWDDTCSEPFTIKKNSVFEIYISTEEDYNPDFVPVSEHYYSVEFLVHDPGKNTRSHHVEHKLKSDIYDYLKRL